MARYKLRPIAVGDHLVDDGGRPVFRADTYQDALEMFVNYGYDEAYIDTTMSAWGAYPRIAYKHDVESGDVHEDAEPGDTVYEFARLRADGTPGRGCVRFWEIG